MNLTYKEALEIFKHLVASAWGEGDREIAWCRHDPALARNLEMLQEDFKEQHNRLCKREEKPKAPRYTVILAYPDGEYYTGWTTVHKKFPRIQDTIQHGIKNVLKACAKANDWSLEESTDNMLVVAVYNGHLTSEWSEW